MAKAMPAGPLTGSDATPVVNLPSRGDTKASGVCQAAAIETSSAAPATASSCGILAGT